MADYCIEIPDADEAFLPLLATPFYNYWPTTLPFMRGVC